MSKMHYKKGFLKNISETKRKALTKMGGLVETEETQEMKIILTKIESTRNAMKGLTESFMDLYESQKKKFDVMQQFSQMSNKIYVSHADVNNVFSNPNDKFALFLHDKGRVMTNIKKCYDSQYLMKMKDELLNPIKLFKDNHYDKVSMLKLKYYNQKTNYEMSLKKLSNFETKQRKITAKNSISLHSFPRTKTPKISENAGFFSPRKATKNAINYQDNNGAYIPNGNNNNTNDIKLETLKNKVKEEEKQLILLRNELKQSVHYMEKEKHTILLDILERYWNYHVTFSKQKFDIVIKESIDQQVSKAETAWMEETVAIEEMKERYDESFDVMYYDKKAGFKENEEANTKIYRYKYTYMLV